MQSMSVGWPQSPDAQDAVDGPSPKAESVSRVIGTIANARAIKVAVSKFLLVMSLPFPFVRD